MCRFKPFFHFAVTNRRKRLTLCKFLHTYAL